MQALELRGEDRRICLAAQAHLKGFKIRLDTAAREYAEAKRIVKNAALRTIATFYEKHARTKLKPITVPELVKELVKTLEMDKRGKYHVRGLEIRLGRFAKNFPCQIADIATEQIENWLRGLTSLAKGGAPRRGAQGPVTEQLPQCHRGTVQLRPEAWLPAQRVVHRSRQCYANKLKRALATV
jgi:hypothetical protein